MLKSFAKILCCSLSCLFPIVSWGSVAQDPLYLVVSADPNVLFNMSIETPMGGAAYNDQPGTLAGGHSCSGRKNGYGICYFDDETYLGYFDPKKCYTYKSSGGYFEPNGATDSRYRCSGKFSGNMMNWATMTAMDMFAYTLTGGNRVIDNTGSNAVTVIKRARRQNNNTWFPRKRLKSSLNVSPGSVTPYSFQNIYIRNYGKGESGGSSSTEIVEFCSDGGNCNTVQGRFQVHVRVCDKTEGLEANCVSYGNGNYYKPEGLVQRKADSMRFAVTSYLKDNSAYRDGGVLRAPMKYVGQTEPDGSGGAQANARAEINADGTFRTDPDGLTGSAGVNHSGVINYINRFSEYGYKSSDPAAELFYESIRYFKNLGPTPEYSSGLTSSMKGGFPVITAWDDPIQYHCQKNFIIGINDANPWLDKSLPGTHFTRSTFGPAGQQVNISEDYGEPSNPDRDINVTSLTNKVGELEGLNGTQQCIGCTENNCDMGANSKLMPKLGEVLGTCPYAGKENSYYIAGLAYYANTQDIRPGMTGEQNIASFIIDTQEYGSNPLVGRMNMLWLAGKYGGFIDSNDNNEPDLPAEWDRDGDGEPDNYVLATRPDKMIAALNASFSEIESRTSSASAVAANSTRLGTDTKIYQARFSSGTWEGSLLAYPVDARTGAVGPVSWDAADRIPAANARNIFSFNSQTGVGIEFQHANLSAAQKAMLDVNQANYVRGDQSKEGATSSSYRVRSSLLGDIINSDPLYTSKENFGYYSLGAGYYNYLLGKTEDWEKGNRPDVIYVGANDGMLHAFLGKGVTTPGCSVASSDCEGEELFAYIPKAVVPGLSDLSSLAYQHSYYVDGSPKHGDAFIDFDDSGSARWGTALVGTLAAGGKGIFALDISDPLNFSAADVLWDLDDTDLNPASDADDASGLGYTFSQPSIVKLANGQWGAIFGNGYHSSNHEPVLYIRNLEDGSKIATFSVGDSYRGAAAATNGLSTPVTVDKDGDKVIDYVYAGDLQGNLWKFDLTDADPAKWSIAFSHKDRGKTVYDPLFQACTDDPCTDPQPITAKPQVVKAPQDNLMVLFGTGKYFEVGDNTDTSQVHSFYGIYDAGAAVSGRTQLLAQSLTSEQTGLQAGVNYDVRTISRHKVNYSRHKGWYLDFDSVNYPGERIVATPLVRHGRVIFPTLVPETAACSYGGTSWLMELDAQSGSNLETSPFDLNDDGSVDKGDWVDSDGDGVKDQAGGGKKSNEGIIDTPWVLEKEKDEVKYASGSSGNIESTLESSGNKLGRQSWLQIR